MKKLFNIIMIFGFFGILSAAEIDFDEVNENTFDDLKQECIEKSISHKCFFVGLHLAYPEFAKKVFNDKATLNFNLQTNKEEGLELLSKACKYDKKSKIKAIKKDLDEKYDIRADAMACYTMFAIYENFSDSSIYHKEYTKALKPYKAEYDGIDILELAKKYTNEQKDMKKALGYYKYMCYEGDLQTQCAKYQGLKSKLKKLCQQGKKYACEY